MFRLLMIILLISCFGWHHVSSSLFQIKQTLLLLALSYNEIGSSAIVQTFPSDTVRNLGVVFDSNFNFRQRISQVIRWHIK